MTRAALTCLLLAAWSLAGKAQEADAMTMPLAAAGDPAIGRAIFSDRESGHCVLCHQVDGVEVPFQGNLGPALSDVGARLTEAQIRLRIVDNTKVNPGTVMPSYSVRLIYIRSGVRIRAKRCSAQRSGAPRGLAVPTNG